MPNRMNFRKKRVLEAHQLGIAEDQRDMEKIAHKTVGVNGINMHIAELGEGPLVLLIHGFPELWYSWRHQILFLAAQGYRAVAPDLRGFGDTTGAPNDDPSKFTVFHIVGDLIELLKSIAPEEEKVFVVGHDWGALIAWHLCMFRPDKVKALVNLSVHFLPRHPHLNHVQSFTAIYGNDFYISRFQEPGEVEAEFAAVGVKTCLRNLLFGFGRAEPFCFPKGAKEYIHNGGFKNDVPLLEDVVVLEGVAHFLNQEAPEEVNNHIYNFIKKF
nr:epoxide hydrolase [Ipomoea batatas]